MIIRSDTARKRLYKGYFRQSIAVDAFRLVPDQRNHQTNREGSLETYNHCKRILRFSEEKKAIFRRILTSLLQDFAKSTFTSIPQTCCLKTSPRSWSFQSSFRATASPMSSLFPPPAAAFAVFRLLPSASLCLRPLPKHNLGLWKTSPSCSPIMPVNRHT